MDDVLEARRARLRVRLGAVVVVLLVALGCFVLASTFGPTSGAVDIERPAPTASAVAVGGAPLFVHILGAVERPGLYELRDGARGVDAVAAAGGFTAAADQTRLNLARFLVDGEQIYVPSIGETPASAPGTTSDGKVNLNTADQTALESLPRVGPAIAQRIIDWREANGAFSSIDDLRSVTGIGDKTFESLKDLVTV